jgi:hypothetical protein
MVPFETGEQVKQTMSGVHIDDTVAEVGLGGFGVLYAWGYGENGRLGLGDIENDAIFETGFDGARQSHYQFVSKAEVVPSLLYKEVTHVACGEEHSAAVSGNTWTGWRYVLVLVWADGELLLMLSRRRFLYVGQWPRRETRQWRRQR